MRFRLGAIKFSHSRLWGLQGFLFALIVIVSSQLGVTSGMPVGFRGLIERVGRKHACAAVLALVWPSHLW